ncbi:hypothetical protein HR12_23515 [Microbacterium sp. SUBG005]|nr:hypothetical protein HR12_48480 [Microbacterium sp. SUBG005]KEP72826.1 hypothetical protein HR12_39890 [Microbacterium sp. SUBG005]KEP75778.1 hypothetical protein HR12_23515 [Microbacterium sp. SUBG005]
MTREVGTGEPVAIVLLDRDNAVAQELGPALARETARCLNGLADNWERSKPIRRLRSVDDNLRELDEGK